MTRYSNMFVNINEVYMYNKEMTLHVYYLGMRGSDCSGTNVSAIGGL